LHRGISVSAINKQNATQSDEEGITGRRFFCFNGILQYSTRDERDRWDWFTDAGEGGGDSRVKIHVADRLIICPAGFQRIRVSYGGLLFLQKRRRLALNFDILGESFVVRESGAGVSEPVGW
jgi:hypothetical protein